VSTAAITAVLAKFAGLSVASKAVIGVAVAASAVGAVPAVAHQFVPDAASVAVVQPAVTSVHHDLVGVRASAKSVPTDTRAHAKSAIADANGAIADTTADVNGAIADTTADINGAIATTTADAKALGADAKPGVDGAVGTAHAATDAAKAELTSAMPDASALVGRVAHNLDAPPVAADASVEGNAHK